jgi:cytochrome oxidase Cu insertion factor (SCO1/SenC/PrrC family)
MSRQPPLVASGNWLRGALWALLVMVMLGLVAVWLHARGLHLPPEPELHVLWQLPGFELIAQDGATVTLEELAGAPWVANLIFTRCAVTCPRMTSRMAALGPHLPPGGHRVSITVDPGHDTPEILASYARSYGAGPDWLFLTGAEGQIQSLAREGFRLGVAPAPEDAPDRHLEPISHSTRFVLVDGQGRIRGYYDAFDETSFRQLQRDLARLAS